MGDKKTLKTLIARIHKNIPLTMKMVVLTVIVGITVWFFLSSILTSSIKDIFQAKLIERLSEQAREDRLNFDRYVKVHHQSVRMFVRLNNFSDYVKKQDWSAEKKFQIKYYTKPPPWFPKGSILRAFAQPRYALLLDSQARVREVYRGRGDALPLSLLKPSALLLAKSHRQSYMTNIEGAPYLVTSESFMNSQRQLLATLVLTCPIDDKFLNSSMGFSRPGHAVALLTPGEKPLILTSNNLEDMPAGTPLEALQDRYLVTGKAFFDYGASDLEISLASFVAMEEVKALTSSVILEEQKGHAISAFVFILTFVLIMLWITHRIHRLAQNVSDFSKDTLGVEQHKMGKGDQIYVLDEQFKRLTDGVLDARNALRKEAEERIALEKKNVEIAQKEKHLNLLHAVTEAVGVGVIASSPSGLKVANKQMGSFAQMFGGLSSFEIREEDSVERSLVDKNGVKRVFHISNQNILDEKIFLVRDITEIKAHTEALEHMALHDSLTGLPNRTLIYDRLRQAILTAKREDKSLALLMLDLDRFKEINDMLGHHIGDKVLKEVGIRLEGVMRKSDTLARIGGDEFAVLLPKSDIDHAKQIASRVLTVLKQPMIVEDNSLYVGASIGIAVYPLHGEDIFQRADIAMYVAKQSQSGFSIYVPEQSQNNLLHFVLKGDLHNAIKNEEELKVYFQPKVNYKTNRICGVEALVRWMHPKHGLINPDGFIPLAERSGLIQPLTIWLLRATIDQCRDWHSIGIEITVSANLSTRNLYDVNLPNLIKEMLETQGLDPKWLELEITESAMMEDPSQAEEILNQLNAIGIRISIDDFGTGYSSLAYIKKLPVKEIKIDRSFVMNMERDENDAIIVRSVIELAHNLGIEVLAEGVENQRIMDMLEKLGCDFAQGNYISPPLPVVKLTQWLSKSLYWGK